jgi:hypothetical protein
MNTKEFMELGKHLLQYFPGFTLKGKLLFMSQVEHTLRGFYFEPSAFDKKSFYINVFFQPSAFLQSTFILTLVTEWG